MTEIINYDKPVKNLIDKMNDTNWVTHNKVRKTSVTLHASGGNLTHEGILNAWRSRGVSMQFAVNGQGLVAQYIVVDEVAWALMDNIVGNQTSIQIEMANQTLAPKWEFSDPTLKATARLVGWLFVYVIDDHPSRDNVLRHDYWSPVRCPGPHMDEVFDVFVEEVQGWYIFFRNQQKEPTTLTVNTFTPESVEIIKNIQLALGVDVNGRWDHNTDQAVLEFRRKHLRR
jgi:hypothetical protein